MKGVVFTEFLDLVETRFSANMVDAIIKDAQLPSGRTYAAMDPYPPEDMVAMVVALSLRSRTPIPTLLRAFGEHLFDRFVQGHPGLFNGVTDTFECLAGMEGLMHGCVNHFGQPIRIDRDPLTTPDGRQRFVLHHLA